MNKKLLERVRVLIKEQDDIMDLAKSGSESAYDNYDEGSWVTDALKVLREIAKENKDEN